MNRFERALHETPNSAIYMALASLGATFLGYIIGYLFTGSAYEPLTVLWKAFYLSSGVAILAYLSAYLVEKLRKVNATSAAAPAQPAAQPGAVISPAPSDYMTIFQRSITLLAGMILFWTMFAAFEHLTHWKSSTMTGFLEYTCGKAWYLVPVLGVIALAIAISHRAGTSTAPWVLRHGGSSLLGVVIIAIVVGIILLFTTIDGVQWIGRKVKSANEYISTVAKAREAWKLDHMTKTETPPTGNGGANTAPSQGSGSNTSFSEKLNGQPQGQTQAGTYYDGTKPIGGASAQAGGPASGANATAGASGTSGTPPATAKAGGTPVDTTTAPESPYE